MDLKELYLLEIFFLLYLNIKALQHPIVTDKRYS